MPPDGFGLRDSIAASNYDKHSVGPSFRPICDRYCSTMTNMMQVCSNFHQARVFITITRPDEIRDTGPPRTPQGAVSLGYPG